MTQKPLSRCSTKNPKSTKQLLMFLYDLSAAVEVGNRITLQCNFEYVKARDIGYKVNCKLPKIA